MELTSIYLQSEPKRHHSVQATRLIHDYYGTIMAFAYSRAPLAQMVKAKFAGEWKYLDRALFELPEERATRALIELGLYIRLVDDDEGQIASKLRSDWAFGEITKADGSQTPLRYRDVANKIIHAERYEWGTSISGDPTVICHVAKDQAARGYNWVSATISLIAVGALCGGMMS